MEAKLNGRKCEVLYFITNAHVTFHSTEVGKRMNYNKTPQYHVSAVGNVNHIIIANDDVKTLEEALCMILTRHGWEMHNPKYKMGWSERFAEWVVRDMEGEMTNWSHPPDDSIKIITMLSGHSESDGIVQPDGY